MEILTEKQNEVLVAIKKFIAKEGFPPTVRELCKKLNLSSSSTIQYHIEKLEKKGYLKKVDTKTRTIELLVENEYIKDKNNVAIPLIDESTSNILESIKSKENKIIFDKELVPNNSFAFRSNTSYKDIKKNDLVIVQKDTYKENDIVLLLIDDKIIFDTYKKENNNQILGKVISIFRKL